MRVNAVSHNERAQVGSNERIFSFTMPKYNPDDAPTHMCVCNIHIMICIYT